VRVWDVARGTALRTFEGHTAAPTGLALTAHGQCVVSAGRDGTVRIWLLGSGHVLFTLRADIHKVERVAATPDGKVIFVGQFSGLRLWRPGFGVTAALEGHTERVTSLAVALDGRLVSASADSIRVWDLTRGVALRTIEGSGDIVLTRDGRRAVSVGSNVRIWDLTTGACEAVLSVDACCVEVIGNGERLCVGATSGEVQFYQVRGLQGAH
jgi:WD40 repeat protein